MQYLSRSKPRGCSGYCLHLLISVQLSVTPQASCRPRAGQLVSLPDSFSPAKQENWSTVQLHGNILKVNTIKTPNHEFFKVEENRRGCLEPQFCQLPLPTKLSNGMTAHNKKKGFSYHRAMPFPKHKLYNTRTLQQHVCVSAVQVELV